MNKGYRLTPKYHPITAICMFLCASKHLNYILSIPSQWEVSCSTVYSPWHFVLRKHVPGQRQGPGRLMSLRNNSLIKWIGTRVTSSAHFMNSPGFANASQSDAVGTARALPVHPSHISKWRAMLKHMGQTKPPELHLLTQDPDSNMRSRASLAIFHNDSAISHSTSSVNKNGLDFGFLQYFTCRI